jgi:hypothetical protein
VNEMAEEKITTVNLISPVRPSNPLDFQKYKILPEPPKFLNHEIKNDNLFVTYSYKERKITFQLNFDVYTFIKNSIEQLKNQGKVSHLPHLLLFESSDCAEFAPALIVHDEESEFTFPETLVNDIISGKIIFPEPRKIVQEQKLTQPKKEGTPAKKPVQPDKTESEIRNLQRQLSQKEEELNEAMTELKKLSEKEENNIEGRDITEFFTDDTLDEEIQKRFEHEFTTEEIKKVEDVLWEITKNLSSKKTSEQTLKQFIIELKWKLAELKYDYDITEAEEFKIRKERDDLQKQLEQLNKEKEDTEKELKTRREQVGKLLEQDLEEWKSIVTEPSKKGYLLSKSKYEILKYLASVQKADWKMLNDNLIGVGKFHSLSTLSTSLNALIQGGFVQKDKNKMYSITKVGLDAKDSYEGK